MATVSHANSLGSQPNLVTSPEKYTTIDTLLEYNAPDNRELLVKTYGDQGITGFLKLTGADRDWETVAIIYSFKC